MTPQQLHDALGDLSDDLLLEADTQRKRKKQPWGTVAALAACLCIAVGIGLFSGTGQPHSATEPEYYPSYPQPVGPEILAAESDRWASIISSNSFRALVLEAGKDHLTVRVTTGDDHFAVDRVLKVCLPEKQLSNYAPGSKVTVYYSAVTTPADANTVQALGIVPIR